MSHFENFLDILLNWQGEKLVISISEQAYILKDNQKIPVLRAPLAGDEIEFIKTEYRKKYGNRQNFKYKDKMIHISENLNRLEFRVSEPESETTENLLESSQDISAEFDMSHIIIPFDETNISPDRIELHEMLRLMADKKASDLHLSSGCPPVMRIDGQIETLKDFPQIDGEDLFKQLASIAPPVNIEAFKKANDTCFGYEIQEYGRYRITISKDYRGIWMSARHIPVEIPPVSTLDIPDEFLGLCDSAGGLLLVSGSTGSGKSTTLASVIQHINRNRQKHIVTIEDPVEFVHYNQSSLVNQRDLSLHVKSFKHALDAAYRQAPDIIAFGEVKTKESVTLMLDAATSGHLVIATISASSPTAAIDRILGQFKIQEQSRTSAWLADALLGILSQSLSRPDGARRIALFESLIVTPKVANLIRERNIFQISSMIHPGGSSPYYLAQHEI